MERLDTLLPKKEYLSVNDVAAVERGILTFDIPQPVIVDFVSGSYVSIQFWRWLRRGAPMGRCPNCLLRQDFGTGKRAILGGGPESNASANVRVNLGCPTEGLPRHDAAQVTIGGCGEARDGTGARFFRSGLQQFDFYAGGAPDLGYCY